MHQKGLYNHWTIQKGSWEITQHYPSLLHPLPMSFAQLLVAQNLFLTLSKIRFRELFLALMLRLWLHTAKSIESSFFKGKIIVRSYCTVSHLKMFIHKIKYIHLWNWVLTSQLYRYGQNCFCMRTGTDYPVSFLILNPGPLKTSFPSGSLKARIWTGFYNIYKEMRNHFYLARRCHPFRVEILECSISWNHVTSLHLNHTSL